MRAYEYNALSLFPSPSNQPAILSVVEYIDVFGCPS